VVGELVKMKGHEDVSQLQVRTTIAHVRGIRRSGLIATWGRLVRTIDSRANVGGLERAECVTCLAVDNNPRNEFARIMPQKLQKRRILLNGEQKGNH
jgi:hypothetical protein